MLLCCDERAAKSPVHKELWCKSRQPARCPGVSMKKIQKKSGKPVDKSPGIVYIWGGTGRNGREWGKKGRNVAVIRE